MIRRGALVVLAVVLLASGCTLPGRVEGPVRLTAVFEDVGDLVAGHSVQVADVRVGSITGIELTDDYAATVTMQLQDDLELPVDSVAVLRTTSLLGEKFIELRPPEEGETSTPAASCDEEVLVSGCQVLATKEAPELEEVAEEAVQVLGAVGTQDVATLIETGAIAYGGRTAELTSLIEDLSVVTGTLARQSDDIVTIIDGLDQATATLAASAPAIDDLLVNLAETTQTLADDRDRTLRALEDLTRLARAQNDLVFGPYRDEIERQIQELDVLLGIVAAQRGEVETLVDWLVPFVEGTQKGIPGDYAQVYGWFQPAVTEAG